MINAVATKTTELLAAEFLAEIEAAIEKHAKAYAKDAQWHQTIVVFSGVFGLLSLTAGAAGYALLAGVLGGVTTMGSVLTQTLHCVKAQGWQDCMRTELDGIRIQFVYEHGSNPSPDALAALGKVSRIAVTNVQGMGTHPQLPIRWTERAAAKGEIHIERCLRRF